MPGAKVGLNYLNEQTTAYKAKINPTSRESEMHSLFVSSET